MSIELDSLIGQKKFSGIDRETVSVDRYGSMENVEVVKFILDGTTYKASENTDDGYRSSMDGIDITEDSVSNKFDPVAVFCRYRKDGTRGDKDDVLEIYNMSGGLILEIGTKNIDDYYPSFVCNFSAEELQKAAA